MVSSWLSPAVRKGEPSTIAGRGLFAVSDLAAGDVVAAKGGHLLTGAELAALPEPLPGSDIQIADDLHLAAVEPDEYDAVMLYLNHSCQPNVGFGGNVLLVAMRDVRAGAELTTD